MPDHDNTSSPTPEAPEPRVLDMRGLWWLPLIIVLAVLAMLLRIVLAGSHSADFLKPEHELTLSDYGYNLESCLVGEDSLEPSGLPRDQIHALSDPPTVPASEIPGINKQERRLYHRKFLVSGDRVIGVEINGEQRAYQINILNYHEVINDTLAGVPIAVVYSPLCDSATVFRREIGGSVRSFGLSGLLLNSNTVMFDRQPELADSSLWSQLQFRAIAGPAAAEGLELEALPCELTHWGVWSEKHPGTTVLARETGESRDYNTNPYLRYYELGEPRFRVSPMPPAGGLKPMDRIVAVHEGGGSWAVYSFADVKAACGEAGTAGRGSLRFEYIPYSRTLDPDGVVVRDPDGSTRLSISALWFAWYAMYPDTRPESF